jgi:hypothetical protein
VSREVIARARAGDWALQLAGTTTVPRDWYPAPIEGLRTLVLAGGGGQ